MLADSKQYVRYSMVLNQSTFSVQSGSGVRLASGDSTVFNGRGGNVISEVQECRSKEAAAAALRCLPETAAAWRSTAAPVESVVASVSLQVGGRQNEKGT